MRLLCAAGMVIASMLPSAALAADMNAAGQAPTRDWSGFYLSAGGGFGWWSADQYTVLSGNPAPPSAHTNGSGGFGTVGAGFDWQFASSWVAGAFADVQFGDIRGTIRAPFEQYYGTTRDKLNYAAGLRLGVLATPDVLIYANGGYSHAEFSGASLNPLPLPPAISVAGHQYDGWFVGGGVENTLDFTGFSSPGWFMKTEYRFADYSRGNAQMYVVPTGVPDNAIAFKPTVQTLSFSLVYRFNEAGGTRF